jgi:hypothetical protein
LAIDATRSAILRCPSKDAQLQEFTQRNFPFSLLLR